MDGCTFCYIARGETEAATVYRSDRILAFLDQRPLFVGHTLVIPVDHHETIEDLPPSLVEPLFTCVQRMSRAVRTAMDSEGTFVAANNRVSQSVPHFHVHVVPRRRGDGLRGFFWPRTAYAGPEHVEEVRARIASTMETGSELA